jgi:hypothetical protein
MSEEIAAWARRELGKNKISVNRIWEGNKFPFPRRGEIGSCRRFSYV